MAVLGKPNLTLIEVNNLYIGTSYRLGLDDENCIYRYRCHFSYYI